ncbi:MULTISPECIES: citrate/2-methylcitrate synthase [unclassified Rhizobium]|uniref:citrate/2-methylcitrate synthase n=1 Tax=unclassified Rhizobium TaxID=2613769 RepID=UPI001AD9B9F2|nr:MULTISPECIES: citrate/2-methylcitrate synthase [unclassified Rhizobium]MBO9124319.1 citrate synthase family protein [Rhizobium sp. 16-488-2b]MBO9174851.1 citrate synthase family protein [Rhizobium sp. 16-488-2a]
MAWLTAEEALERLGTKPQTLYANVSRGRIRAKPDAADSRRSLYHSEDVARLAKRHAGRGKAEAIAAETIDWGEPVLPTAISTIADGRLYYRGREAVALSERATFEQVAALLWDSPAAKCPPVELSADEPSRISGAFVLLARRAAADLPALGRAPAALKSEAGQVLATVAAALAPSQTLDLPLHERLAQSWDRPEAAEPIRRALVLAAEHELNVSAFAARVTASSGASLAAATLSGLSTLTGPRHGGAWQGAVRLMELSREIGAREAIRTMLATEGLVRAFGHKLYPDGDPRAATIMSSFEMPKLYAEIAGLGAELLGEPANIDFALAAMAGHFDLPDDAPLVIFALSRTAGWLAHAIEQVTSGTMIRPRARYVGPSPEAL